MLDTLLENAEISRRELVLVNIPKTGTQSLDKSIVSACAGEPQDGSPKFEIDAFRALPGFVWIP
jgi:hypothetical protein